MCGHCYVCACFAANTYYSSVLSAAADRCLSGLAGNKWYRGGLDSAVLPYAVMSTSAANHIRVGFLHKQSQEDKEASAASHDGEVLLSTTLHMHSMLTLLRRGQAYASAPCHTKPDLPLDHGSAEHSVVSRAWW